MKWSDSLVIWENCSIILNPQRLLEYLILSTLLVNFSYTLEGFVHLISPSEVVLEPTETFYVLSILECFFVFVSIGNFSHKYDSKIEYSPIYSYWLVFLGFETKIPLNILCRSQGKYRGNKAAITRYIAKITRVCYPNDPNFACYLRR